MEIIYFHLHQQNHQVLHINKYTYGSITAGGIGIQVGIYQCPDRKSNITSTRLMLVIFFSMYNYIFTCI